MLRYQTNLDHTTISLFAPWPKHSCGPVVVPVPVPVPVPAVVVVVPITDSYCFAKRVSDPGQACLSDWIET